MTKSNICIKWSNNNISRNTEDKNFKSRHVKNIDLAYKTAKKKY